MADSRRMNDPYDLQRFVRAQDTNFESARDELRRGRKTNHWMWYVFPQIEGLGHSAMSQTFAINSKAEALAYLAHPVLGARLTECTNIVNVGRAQCEPNLWIAGRYEVQILDDAVSWSLS